MKTNHSFTMAVEFYLLAHAPYRAQYLFFYPDPLWRVIAVTRLMTTTMKGGHCFQEAIETLDPGKEFDMELDGKLHVLYGGTKVVQHSPPSKTGPGLKGR